MMQACKAFPKPVLPNSMSYQIELRDGPWHHNQTVVVTAGPGQQVELDHAVRNILKALRKPETFVWR